LYRKPYLKN